MSYRTCLVACVVLIFVAPSGAALAAVVPFDINPDVPVVPAGIIPGGNFIGGQFTYYNIQFVIDGGASDINIRTSRAVDGGTPDQVTSDGFNGSSIVTKGGDSYLNAPFTAGDVIGDGVNEFVRPVEIFSVLNDGGTTQYVSGANFLGIKLASGNYGYVQVNYDPANSTYTFVGGAYQTGGGTITAGGNVPEPASAALLAVGGIVGAAVAQSRDWVHLEQRWPPADGTIVPAERRSGRTGAAHAI